MNLSVKVMDNAFATGVDDVSCTAKSTDPGYQPDTWIMAPSGTVPGTSSPCANHTIFKISPIVREAAGDLMIASSSSFRD